MRELPTHSPNGNPVFVDRSGAKKIKDNVGDGYEWEYEGNRYKYPFYIIQTKYGTLEEPDGIPNPKFPDDYVTVLHEGYCKLIKQWAYYYEERVIKPDEPFFVEEDFTQGFQKQPTQQAYPVGWAPYCKK